jgi:hypothetical protein
MLPKAARSSQDGWRGCSWGGGGARINIRLVEEGPLHNLLELKSNVFVEPISQEQGLPTPAIEVRPLLFEPVFFETQ